MNINTIKTKTIIKQTRISDYYNVNNINNNFYLVDDNFNNHDITYHLEKNKDNKDNKDNNDNYINTNKDKKDNNYKILKKKSIIDYFNLDDVYNINNDCNINNIGNDEHKELTYNYNIKKIEIYTDGSSYNNGKKNCRASWAYNIYEDDICIYKESGKCIDNDTSKQSNQIAELLSIYYAINKSYQLYDKIYDNNRLNYNCIYIYSDSMYSIKCINEWSNKWTSADWNRKKNTDIIMKIKKLIKDCNFQIVFIHIFSHQNNSLNKHHIRNNIVDKEAKKKNNL